MWRKRTEDLTEVIPKQCLPVEYGGTQPSIKILTGAYVLILIVLSIVVRIFNLMLFFVFASVLLFSDLFYKFGEQYQDWLYEEEKNKADLTLKPRRCSNSARPEVMDGSFRKLCLD